MLCFVARTGGADAYTSMPKNESNQKKVVTLLHKKLKPM
jgi:hypothetical protein